MNHKVGDFVIFKRGEYMDINDSPVWHNAEGTILEVHTSEENHVYGWYVILWYLLDGNTVKDEISELYDDSLHKNIKKYRKIKLNNLLC